MWPARLLPSLWEQPEVGEAWPPPPTPLLWTESPPCTDADSENTLMNRHKTAHPCVSWGTFCHQLARKVCSRGEVSLMEPAPRGPR